jgi:hypothetical protein
VPIPLDYAAPSVRQGRIAILPFLALGLFLLEFPVAFICFIMEAGNMGDNRGMSQATRDEMGRAFIVAITPAVLGFLIAIGALLRFRHYGRVGRILALITFCLYAVPLLLYVYEALRP